MGCFDRGSDSHDDAQAARELERVDVGLPAGLDVAWLGVSGYRLTYEGVSLFVDPYVSRVPLRAMLLRRTALPDPVMLDRYATAPGEVAGILVGHTHFDHAVDAPALARRYGTKAYGSESLAHLMRLHGLGDQAVVVEPHTPYELGPFVVTFVPSRHSKLLFGRKVPMDGELTCDHLDGLAPGAYKCGAVYGIRIEVAGRLALPPGQRGPRRRGASRRAGRRLPRRRRRPQLHAALLAADPAQARPARRRPDALRQLLLAARRQAGPPAPRGPRGRPARGRGGGARRPRRRAAADRRLTAYFTAFFTSAAIFFSSAGSSSISAKEVGHIAPASRFALSLKPSVA